MRFLWVDPRSLGLCLALPLNFCLFSFHWVTLDRLPRQQFVPKLVFTPKTLGTYILFVRKKSPCLGYICCSSELSLCLFLSAVGVPFLCYLVLVASKRLIAAFQGGNTSVDQHCECNVPTFLPGTAWLRLYLCVEPGPEVINSEWHGYL